MTPGRRRIARIAAFIIAIALLVAAVIAILRSAPTIDQVRAAVVHPDPTKVLLCIAALLVNIVACGGIFHALLASFGRIRRFEMVQLIATSSVLNYLPLRPGLIGRIAHQDVVNGIPLRRSAISVVEAGAVCACSIVWLAGAVALAHWTGIDTLGWIVAALPSLGWCARRTSQPTTVQRLLNALAWRQVDLLAWGVRYWAVFGLLGVSLSPIDCARAVCIGGTANLVPFIGNGLGIREWAIGLAGERMALWSTDVGLAAELLNRAADVAVAVPIGLLCAVPITRRLRAAMAARDGTASGS
jgi:uncharacterized membrane protein YbhN (UPF0104 family)